MAPREDLVASAVTFLRDPSVASSPLDKRIEFLKSKNLTQEEIDASLARAAEDPSLGASVQAAYALTPPGRGPPTGLYANYPYNPYGHAGYGLWLLADRYIKPLVAPPTPPQLEQDKAAIDEQFNKAFALLDTLAADTTALKEAEEQRTKRLDAAIADIESIASELRTATQRRQDEARRMESEINTMKDSLPRSIDNVRDASERQLKELSTELSSLKLLMSNRLASSPSPMAAIPKTQPANISAASSLPGVNGTVNAPSVASPAVVAPRSIASTPFGGGGAKASIPAWQMAAQKAQKDASYTAAASTSSAGTAHSQPAVINPNNDGADAVAALNSV
ncbi:hypothetical protein DV738_g4866, partial [Chaetothyriales sp. CBS 135597]